MKEMILYSVIAILLLLVFSVYAAEAVTEGASVTVRPGRVDTVMFESTIGQVNIQTDSPGRYSIYIAGVPDSWLDYPTSVFVEDEETVNYAINPEKAGSYRLSIFVEGPGGERA